MAEKLILTDGLRIGKKELAQLQNAAQTNLSRMIGLVATIPAGGAVFTTKSTAGVLGTQLLAVPSGTTASVNAGTAISGDLTYINVPVSTAPTGTFANSTSVKVILTATSSTLEAGTVSVASDHISLTFTVNSSALYAAGEYIRLSNSVSGNNGTYRILSISGTTGVLSDPTPGPAESGLSHSQAGKFFPGYPIAGTTDEASHDGFVLTYQATSYTPLANEIHLATLAKDGGGNVSLTTDLRVPIIPNTIGRIITDSDVSNTAAIAESKIALAASTINAKNFAHAQNTDTYTTSSIYRVAGVSGPRVLTTDDLPTAVPPSPPPATAPTVLAQEVNYRVSFFNTLQSPDGNIFNGQKVAGINAYWGIVGTGTYSAGVFSLTSAHDAQSSLGANALVDHVLVDTAGRMYKITASQAVAAITAFTVTVSVDVANGQPNPTNGAVTIRNAAKSYSLSVVDTVTNAVSNFTPTTPANGIIATNFTPPMTGVGGRTYQVNLISTNNSLAPTSQTLTTTVVWGKTTALTINVPSTSISAVPNAAGVKFNWPAPANYDRSVMDYAVAWSNSSTNPTFYNKIADENSDGSGSTFISATWPQIALINVKVIDMSGVSLSTTAGTASAQPTNVTTNPIQSYAIGFSLTNGNFVLTGSNYLATAVIGAQGLRVFPRYVSCAAIGINITSNSGDMQIKGWVYPVGNFAGGFASVPASSPAGEVQTNFDIGTARLGSRVQIDVEKISGSTGTVVGQIWLYYVETGSIQAPTQPTY